MQRFEISEIRFKNPTDFEESELSLDLSTKMPTDSPHGNRFSVLIGKNGSGKSSLLADIANYFQGISNQKTRRIPSRLVTFINFTGPYRSLPHEFLTRLEEDQRRSGPNRIIAVAMTPYDKFRQSPRDDGKGNYFYIGHKRGNNLHSPIFRTIDRLVSDLERFERISEGVVNIFDFLDLHPEIHLRYKWSSAITNINSTDDLLAYISNFTAKSEADNNSTWRPDVTLSKSRDYYIEAFESISINRSNYSIKYFEMNIDFRRTRQLNEFQLDNLQLLREIGLVSLVRIDVVDKSGIKFNLQNSSSGQLSLLTSTLGILSVLEEGSLILIDEPEVSLHPEWQREYITVLQQAVDTYYGCHVIIATHSPLIVASAFQDMKVLSLDAENKNFEPSGSFPSSSDYTLLEVFGTVTDENLYLRELLINAVQLASSGEYESYEFLSLISHLRTFLPILSEDSRAREMIIELISFSANSKDWT